MPMASRSPGIASMMSTVRMITPSIVPLKKPAMAPRKPPTMTPIVTDSTAIPSVRRAPQMIRESTSWPWMFVPIQCSDDGGRKLSDRLPRSGSNGARNGAKTAMNTIAPTISAPMIADLLCRIRRNASRQRPTGLSSATPIEGGGDGAHE